MKSTGVDQYLNPVDMRAMTSRIPSPRGSRVSAGGVRKIPRYQRDRIRRAAVELLRLAKQTMTYREVSRITGLCITAISRYVRSHVVPGFDRALMLWKTLDPLVGLQATLVRTVKTGPVVDVQTVIGDPSILSLAAADCLARYAGYRVTKIMTAAVNGIPLAAAVAQVINARLVIARTSRPVDGGELLETVYTRNGESVEYLYLPSRLVSHTDSVLIVDDMVRTGRTVRAIQRLLERVKPKDGRRPEVAGVYCLIGFRDAVERLRESGLRVECALEVVE